jgi:hypothetical protein
MIDVEYLIKLRDYYQKINCMDAINDPEDLEELKTALRRAMKIIEKNRFGDEFTILDSRIAQIDDKIKHIVKKTDEIYGLCSLINKPKNKPKKLSRWSKFKRMIKDVILTIKNHYE